MKAGEVEISGGDLEQLVAQCLAWGGKVEYLSNENPGWVILSRQIPGVVKKALMTAFGGTPKAGSFPGSSEDAHHASTKHCLLFPRDEHGLCPRSWFDAAQGFLRKFNSDPVFDPVVTWLYPEVTLLGPPLGTRFGIGADVEAALSEVNWIRVERLWCSSAAELEAILQRRLDEDVRFRGKDEGK